MYKSAFERGAVQERWFWCTKASSGGSWCTRQGFPVRKRGAAGDLITSEAWPETLTTVRSAASGKGFSVRNQRILYEMIFGVVSYSVAEVL